MDYTSSLVWSSSMWVHNFAQSDVTSVLIWCCLCSHSPLTCSRVSFNTFSSLHPGSTLSMSTHSVTFKMYAFSRLHPLGDLADKAVVVVYRWHGVIDPKRKFQTTWEQLLLLKEAKSKSPYLPTKRISIRRTTMRCTCWVRKLRKKSRLSMSRLGWRILIELFEQTWVIFILLVVYFEPGLTKWVSTTHRSFSLGLWRMER